MKMVAAAKLKEELKKMLRKGRPYSEKMQNIILNLTKWH